MSVSGCKRFHFIHSESRAPITQLLYCAVVSHGGIRIIDLSDTRDFIVVVYKDI